MGVDGTSQGHNGRTMEEWYNDGFPSFPTTNGRPLLKRKRDETDNGREQDMHKFRRLRLVYTR